MTPDELRERMIEVAMESTMAGVGSYPRYRSIVNALLEAGAAEQWVMPWMTDVRHPDVEDQPFYRMREHDD